MASRSLETTAFLLTINLLFFTLVTSHHTPKGCPPPPPPPCSPSPTPTTPSPPKTPTPSPPKTPTPSPPKTPTPSPPKTPTTSPPTPSPPKTPTPSPPKATCPKDTLKLGVCANLLNDLIHLVVGNPPKTPCCTLLNGLADLEAAVCLCTAIKANILGINLNIPISLSLLLNYCGKKVPSGFQCA